MNQFMYSIYDSAVKYFMFPFPARNAEEAKRIFEAGVKDSKSTLHQDPANFLLYEVGAFVPQTGKIEVHEVPGFVAQGSSLVSEVDVDPAVIFMLKQALTPDIEKLRNLHNQIIEDWRESIRSFAKHAAKSDKTGRSNFFARLFFGAE